MSLVRRARILDSRLRGNDNLKVTASAKGFKDKMFLLRKTINRNAFHLKAELPAVMLSGRPRSCTPNGRISAFTDSLCVDQRVDVHGRRRFERTCF